MYSVFQVSRDKPLGVNHTLTNSSEPSVESSEPSTGSPRHLASGTIAGIAIGAVLGVIIALVLLLYIIRRHQMRKNPPSEPPLVEELPEDSWATPREELWANEPAAVELLELPEQSSVKGPDPTLEPPQKG